MLSEVRYARSGDVNIAYRVFGDGPFDVVLVPGTTSHVDFVMEVPAIRAIFEQIASFSRLIFFDKRGTGLSDPVDAGTPLEVRMDDVRAVMDAAGSEHAAVMGVSEGGPMSILFAATYPERAWALVLYGTYARELWAHDYPWGTPEADYRSALETMPTRAARPERFDEIARSGCPNSTEEELAALSRYLRIGGSLAAQVALARMNMGIDVRDVLGAIRVPTLVLHCARDPWVTVAQGRYLAERIPTSTYVELDCDMHIPAEVEVPMIVGAVRPFLQRAWATRLEEAVEPDRVLATVLFTDIAGSSEHAATLGDRIWRQKLEQHHELVRRQLLRFSRRGGRHRRRRILCLLRRAGARDSLRIGDHVRRARARPRRPRGAAHRRMRARRRQGGGHRRPHGRTRCLAGPAGRGTRFEHGQRSRRGLRHCVRGSRSQRAERHSRQVAALRRRGRLSTRGT